METLDSSYVKKIPGGGKLMRIRGNLSGYDSRCKTSLSIACILAQPLSSTSSNCFILTAFTSLPSATLSFAPLNQHCLFGLPFLPTLIPFACLTFASLKVLSAQGQCKLGGIAITQLNHLVRNFLQILSVAST